MHIVIAAALLVMLFSHIWEKNNLSQHSTVKSKKDDLYWIDELEILDAVMDDFE